MDLRDKVVLVTGAASGLGRATAQAFAEEGAQLALADIDEKGGRDVADRVDGIFINCDVSSLEANRALVDEVVERLGGLDVVHLNAGVSTGCGVGDDFDLELYRRAMDVNLDGVVFGAHAALPALRARGGGAIVATASLAGLTPMPLDPIYTANKHAVVGLARALGPALAEQNVTFNAVCPGFADSRIVDAWRGDLAAAGIPLIPAEAVGAAVVRIVREGGTGEAWFVQAGREPDRFRFRNVPGPRPLEAEA